MKQKLFFLLAIVVGLVVGSALNMGIIMLGTKLIPLPAGIDPMDPESLAANIHLFEMKHYIAPFLAHALGTLVGAYVAAKLSKTKKFVAAMVVTVLFLLGGIMNAFMIPAPVWFIVLDLVVAYLPMGWLGHKWATRS